MKHLSEKIRSARESEENKALPTLETVAKHLNPSQLQAANATEGPVLIIAGAGTGKTRVIEYRVLNLVLQGVSPSSILLLTFTKKAAQQLLHRAARNHPAAKNVEGGTFHSFGYKMLKKYAPSLGLSSNFTVIDEKDSEDAVERCMGMLDIHGKEKNFPKASIVHTMISKSNCKSLSVEQVINNEHPSLASFIPSIASIQREYTKYKVYRNLVDYDDMILYLKLLLENEQVGAAFARRYKYVMVDEFQDTNKIEGEIVRRIGNLVGNIMAVGDDAQTIYGFRGSNHSNIIGFPEWFSGTAIIKLEHNYRSTGQILSLANHIQGLMGKKHDKKLVSALGRKGSKPQLLFFKDTFDEADWICGKILEHKRAGMPLERQAVLCRSVFVSIQLQLELANRQIPFQVIGGFAFFELAHVKDFLAHFRLLANPKDELSWMRTLKLLRGIGSRHASRLSGELIANSTLPSMLQTLKSHASGHPYSEGIAALHKVLQEASNSQNNIPALCKAFSGYYLPQLANLYPQDAEARKMDIVALSAIASSYEDIEPLLADMMLEPPRHKELALPQEEEAEKPLALSTIHSAKGLEWDVVYFLGVKDGVIPSARCVQNEEALEEEKRVFYVAATRAKDHLYMTVAQHMGHSWQGGSLGDISRFLDSDEAREKLEIIDKKEQPLEFLTYDKESLLKRIEKMREGKK
jgi:DNA helicase-2/ATP-dependent DNA helicase PcrA